MALSPKDKEIDRLAWAAAALTGETLTDADGLERERLRQGESRRLAGQLMEIGRHCATRPDLDPRGPDEIVGYDENGLW